MTLTSMTYKKPEDFEIIDAHTHPFIDPESNVGQYGTPETMEEFEAEMHKVCVSRYAGCVITPPCEDFAVVRKCNDQALFLRDKFPAYIPGIHVYSNHIEESLEELHRLHGEGVRLVGELVPHRFNRKCAYDIKTVMPLCTEMEKLDMVVSIHEGRRSQIEPIARRFPKLNMILAHPGEPWGDPELNAKKRFDFIKDYSNLFMDVSGYGIFRWGMLRYAVDICGTNKIIFGSDMPTCPVGMYLFACLCENMTDDELKLILAGNFKRLMKL